MTEISRERKDGLRYEIGAPPEDGSDPRLWAAVCVGPDASEVYISRSELLILLDHDDERDRLVKQRDHERKRRAKAEPERDEAMALLRQARNGLTDIDHIDALLRRVGGNDE